MRGRSARSAVSSVVQSNVSDVSGEGSLMESTHSKRSSRGSHADVESNTATPSSTPVHERQQPHLSLPPDQLQLDADVMRVVCKQLPVEVQSFCSDANQNVEMTSLIGTSETSDSVCVVTNDSRNGNTRCAHENDTHTELERNLHSTTHPVTKAAAAHQTHNPSSYSPPLNSVSDNEASHARDVITPDLRRNCSFARSGRSHRISSLRANDVIERELTRAERNDAALTSPVLIGSPVVMTSDDDDADVLMPTPELRNSVESLRNHADVMTSSYELDSSADDAEDDVDVDLPPRRRRKNANDATRQHHLLTSSQSSEHLQRELSLMKCSSDGLSDKEVRAKSMRMQLKRNDPLAVSSPSHLSPALFPLLHFHFADLKVSVTFHHRKDLNI